MDVIVLLTLCRVSAGKPFCSPICGIILSFAPSRDLQCKNKITICRKRPLLLFCISCHLPGSNQHNFTLPHASVGLHHLMASAHSLFPLLSRRLTWRGESHPHSQCVCKVLQQRYYPSLEAIKGSIKRAGNLHELVQLCLCLP